MSAIKHVITPTADQQKKNKNFKIAISYPPMPSEKGIPLLAQNRQFQWFANPTYIYPMVPAYAATLLKENGYKVMWDDGIAEELSQDEWLARIKKFRPDLIVLESKTPVIKRHWKAIDAIKSELPKTKIVLVGDHVTALPRESMENSKVDFVATGGDYDFLALNIANHINHREELEPGIWFRKGRQIENTGHFLLNHNLDELPMIDRDLTQWKLYAYKNGNYKKTPGTYTMAARDCWWGRCAFCSWTTLYPGKDYRKHSVKRMLDEIGILIEKYHIKEIMDDSGTFPIGSWLKEFCQGMIERGYNKKIRLDVNMRLRGLNQEEYDLMGRAGFRFILYGLESANQKTLDRINKNLKVAEIEKGVAMAKKAGLDPHITTMMGYPWETRDDAQRTIDLSKKLFDKGYVDTLQATVVTPYPGTPLFNECKKNGWLKTLDWDDYDQRMEVMRSPLTDQDVKELTQSLYKSFVTPRFILRKILSVRSFSDISFLFRAAGKVLGHLTDFSPKAKNSCNQVINSFTMEKTLPKLSIMIVTLNNANTLTDCLQSIVEQDYPKNLIEYINIDGGSTDDTKKLMKKFGFKVVDSPIKRNAEAQRAVGLSMIKNPIWVVLDADNYLPHKKWLRQMVEPFMKEEKVFYTQTLRFTHQKSASLFNRYCSLFGMNDSMVYYIGKPDRISWFAKRWTRGDEVIEKKNYYLVKYSEKNLPTLGCNGIMVKKDVLLKYAQVAPDKFLHTDIYVDLIRKGISEGYAVVKNDVIHATAYSLQNLIKKRTAFLAYFFGQKTPRRYQIYNPAKLTDNLKMLKFIIYTITLIVPLFDSIRGYIKIRDRAWFLHPVACWAFLYAYGMATLKRIFYKLIS